MDDSIPSAEDIAKLKKKVKLARHKVETFQQLLRDKGDASRKFGETEVALALLRVPTNDEEEESILFAFYIAKAQLGEAIEALEFAKERRRVDEVVKARMEEIDIGNEVDDCPICLDQLHAGVMDRLTDCRLHCCGKQICAACYMEFQERGMFNQCPLCRHKYPVSQSFIKKMKKKHAETKPYYQYLIGREYFDGLNGGISKSNDEKALQLITKAAEGGDAEAQALLGFFYRRSPRGIVIQSYDVAMHWFELAATKGHIQAHLNVVQTSIAVDGGISEKNTDLICRYQTFSAQHGSLTAQLQMADYYTKFAAEGIPVSLEGATYWLGKAVHAPESAIAKEIGSEAYAEYAVVLLQLSTKNKNGVVDMAGHSSIPEALFWFRKAIQTKHMSKRGGMSEQQLQLMKACEEIGTKRCNCCKVLSEDFEAVESREMRKCSRCHWARYCSKECQLRHWDMGHNKDCKNKY